MKPEARRATHVRKTKGQAMVTGKEWARSQAPSPLLA